LYCYKVKLPFLVNVTARRKMGWRDIKEAAESKSEITMGCTGAVAGEMEMWNLCETLPSHHKVALHG
jgi:hypothetical protein